METTNPTSPVQRGYIAGSLSGWSPSAWRDARTYGQYTYVVTEGGGGMQVINLANPNSPVFVRTHRPGGVNWGNTHNISIDLATGKLYVVGTAGGMHIFDVAANPTNPPYVGSYTAEYVHDVQVREGVAFLSEINRGFLRLLDVRNLPAMPHLGVIGYGAAHQAWPSPDGDYVAGASEAVGGYVGIFDVTNYASIRQVARFNFPSNPYRPACTTCSTAITSSLRLVPGWLRRVRHGRSRSTRSRWATTDTFAGTGVFSGAWGCYPFQPSGNVYLSDIMSGLYVFRLRGAPVHYGSAVAAPSGTAPEIATCGSKWLGSPSVRARGAQGGARFAGVLLRRHERRERCVRRAHATGTRRWAASPRRPRVPAASPARASPCRTTRRSTASNSTPRPWCPSQAPRARHRDERWPARRALRALTPRAGSMTREVRTPLRVVPGVAAQRVRKRCTVVWRYSLAGAQRVSAGSAAR